MRFRSYARLAELTRQSRRCMHRDFLSFYEDVLRRKNPRGIKGSRSGLNIVRSLAQESLSLFSKAMLFNGLLVQGFTLLLLCLRVLRYGISGIQLLLNHCWYEMLSRSLMKMPSGTSS